MVMLFDDRERIDQDPAKYAEPSYDYLNRSARQSASNIRATITDWFSHYPSAEQEELLARFRTSDDPQHFAAFYELFLHELLLRLGCRVTIHPELEGSPKSPDFLVETPEGSQFYLEATTATDTSEEKAAAEKRRNQIYDAVDQLESPDFFICINEYTAPEIPISIKHIKRFLREKLDKLDPDKIALIYKSGGYAALPRWYYEDRGWKIEFLPIPKKQEARGKNGQRLIGSRFTGWQAIRTKFTVRDAILKKASRYGNFNLPYIIAINNAAKWRVHCDSLIEALFGEEQFIVTFEQEDATNNEPVMSRAPNGVWIGASGPRYTRVSGVLYTSQVLPWNIPDAYACLYHNPWAANPCGSILSELTQASVVDGKMNWTEGKSLANILDLPPNWLED
jgi:hypothetical protein